jgi:hypothetical protein
MLTRPTEAAGGRPFNILLRRLNGTDFARIAPHLVATEAGPNDLLYSPGDGVEIVHFPCGPSLVSYMVPNEDGRDVEALRTGREGAGRGHCQPGLSAGRYPDHVQIRRPVRLPVARLDAAKSTSRTLSNVFARYADCMLAQIFQSTACNAIHSIEQRIAKWIFSAMERTDGDEVVPLTHE